MGNNNFGLTLELMDQILPALKNWDFEKVHDLIAPLHAADLSDLIANMADAEREQIINMLRTRLDPEIFNSLNECIKEHIVNQLDIKSLINIAKNQPSDVVAQLIRDLSTEEKISVLSQVNEQTREEVEDILELPKSTAGWLMQKDYITVPAHWSVKESLDFIKKTAFDNIQTIFLHNPQHQPIATISLGSIIRAKESDLLDNLYKEKLYLVKIDEQQSDVALIFRRHEITAMGVVDDKGRLLGVIHAHNMLQIIHDVAEEDALKLNGVDAVDAYLSVWDTAINRLRWLMATLVNAIIASSVISQFQPIIEKVIALAVLMPIVASMGGNTGMQVVTITIRSLATNRMRLRNLWNVILKEIKVVSINGLLLSGLLASVTFLWFRQFNIALVLMIALVINMLWAALAGVVLPIFIHKLGKDPALSAGPILTTTTDVLGFSIFLGIAKLMIL